MRHTNCIRDASRSGGTAGEDALMRSRLVGIVLACLALAGPLFATAHAGTLDDVRARGRLLCGIGDGLRGFSEKDAAGRWQGFDVDFCKAVAAAVFGDAGKVEYVPLPTLDRFQALIGNRIDLLAKSSTWTMSR